MICDVIGVSKDLLRYDNLRSILKEGQSETHSNDHRQHDTLLALLQTQVLRMFYKLARQIKSFEMTSSSQFGTIPDTLTPEWKENIGRLSIAKCFYALGILLLKYKQTLEQFLLG